MSGTGRSWPPSRSTNTRSRQRPNDDDDSDRQKSRKVVFTDTHRHVHGTSERQRQIPGNLLPRPNTTADRGMTTQGQRMPVVDFNASRSNPQAPVWNVQPPRASAANNPNVRTPTQHPLLSAQMPSLRPPARKKGSVAPPMQWQPPGPDTSPARRIAATPRTRPPVQFSKSSQLAKPLWQHQSEVFEARKKGSSSGGNEGIRFSENRTTLQTPARRVYLSPHLRLEQEPASSSDGDDSIEYTPTRSQPLQYAAKGMSGRRLVNMKAARKLRYFSDDEISDDEDAISLTSSSDDSEDGSRYASTESDKEQEREIQGLEREIIDLTVEEPSQPVITIPLAQVAPVQSQPSEESVVRPPSALLATVGELCLPSIRMQETGQLPFLRRNLRRGFRLRCGALNIRTTKSRPKMPVLVRYEHVDESVYETYISRWLCPLCELHGAFPNKEMLRCHIQWDHREVLLERWEQRMNNQGKPEWRIQLLIPETAEEPEYPTMVFSFTPEPEDVVIAKGEPEEPSSLLPPPDPHRIGSLVGQRLRTPLRSPSPSNEPTFGSPILLQERSMTRVSSSPMSVRTKDEWRDFRSTESPLGEFKRPEEPPRTTRSTSSFRSSTNFTTSSVDTPSTVRARETLSPPYTGQPLPPEPTHDQLLGPAARPPYLPAKSEYGGPDVYYSCRPGGPSVYDLLRTLPLEPFGVLDWAVLEREEEIFESDDVKVEYKVMHALWGRWIMLSRNEFIKNYYKGTIQFVDMYWKMIHQAAGWEALRYWLLILLAHRFLTAREVAKVLRHYEDLVGMSG